MKAVKPGVRIVIVGGGVGGTIVANLLARKAPRADITLLDRTGKHVYQPGFLYVAFGRQNPGKLVREERSLLHRRVTLVVGEVERVDPSSNAVHLGDGRTFPYDLLVLATGAELVHDAIPDDPSVHQFYTMAGAVRLREALRAFPGGRIVVAIAGMPYKCPPAPAEAACQLDYYFTKRGMRGKVDIRYLSPLGRVFPIESVSPVIQSLFDRKRVRYTTFFNVERVDTSAKVVHSLEGESTPYDLLILVPPHRGVAFAKASGMADAGGWIPTDKHTLEVKGHEGSIWALGDATDIPISKSGATAHFESKVVAKNVLAALRGAAREARYNGRVMCFFDAGFRRATALRFDYGHPPQPRVVSRRWYLGKMLMNKLYWSLIPKARA